MDGYISNRESLKQDSFGNGYVESQHASVARVNDDSSHRSKPKPVFAAKLLLVDGGEQASALCDVLSENGIQTSLERDGQRAARRAVQEHFDAILIDAGLAGSDGISSFGPLRSGLTGPIIVVSGSDNESDEVMAIEAGADDYVAKPVRAHALVARLKRHFDRSSVACSEMRIIGVRGLQINLIKRSVYVRGAPIELSSTEFDLLAFLAERAGQVVPRKQLYEQLLDTKYNGSDRLIDLRISRIRRKIGDDSNDPIWVKSIRGVGYLFALESVNG